MERRRQIIKKVRILQKMEELEEKEELEKKKRAYWVNPFLAERCSNFWEEKLLETLLWEQNNLFKNFTRLTFEHHNEILLLVKDDIQKKDTTFRQAVSARIRLAITLRFLATGDSYQSLEFLSHVSRKTISRFIPEVLTALYTKLQPTYLKMTNMETEWQMIIEDYWNIWNFPHTLGSIDGKHIRITKPPHSGSNYHNYKGFHSIILLAIVDAHSRFIFIDVGANGRASDNTVSENTIFFNTIDQLHIPESTVSEGETMPIHNFFIADDAFKLDRHMMKPYTRCQVLTTKQKIFNYRLSRARLTVECAFGRLASRFRIFHRPIDVQIETIDMIVKVCCVLHNYLTKPIERGVRCDDIKTTKLPPTICSLESNKNLTNSNKLVHTMRDTIANFCVGKGDIPYQWDKIGMLN